MTNLLNYCKNVHLIDCTYKLSNPIFNIVTTWFLMNECRKWYSRPVFWNRTWGSECWNEAFPPGGKGVSLLFFTISLTLLLTWKSSFAPLPNSSPTTKWKSYPIFYWWDLQFALLHHPQSSTDGKPSLLFFTIASLLLTRDLLCSSSPFTPTDWKSYGTVILSAGWFFGQHAQCWSIMVPLMAMGGLLHPIIRHL